MAYRVADIDVDALTEVLEHLFQVAGARRTQTIRIELTLFIFKEKKR